MEITGRAFDAFYINEGSTLETIGGKGQSVLKFSSGFIYLVLNVYRIFNIKVLCNKILANLKVADQLNIFSFNTE